MITNGNYLAKEIAYRNNEDGGYSVVRDSIDEIFTDLFNFACENPELESDWKNYEQMHTTIYKDEYYVDKDDIHYLIQHDIVTNDLVLYELKEIENYEH